MTSYFYFSLILGIITFITMTTWLIIHSIKGKHPPRVEKIIAPILCVLLIIVGINNLINIINVAGGLEYVGILISQQPMYTIWPLLTLITAPAVALATFVKHPNLNRWTYLWFAYFMTIYLFLNMLADLVKL